MTTILAMIPGLLDAIVAIPKIGSMFQQAIAAVVLWYVQKQTATTLSAISDAAALAARATTDDERFKAAKAWQDALSRPRVTPS